LIKAIRQVEELYNRLPVVCIALIVVSVASVATLRQGSQLAPLLYWFAYMSIINGIRMYSVFRFKQSKSYRTEPQYWLNLFKVGSVFSGLGAGYLFYTYFDVNQIHVCIFIVMLYSGYVAANTNSTACYFPTLLMSAVPPTIMLVVRMLQESEQAYTALAFMLFVYSLVMLSFAKRVNQTFSDNVEWAFERDEVINELREQKMAVEHAMKSKTNFLASASHDLRQPLQAIGLFHDALRYRINDPESLDIMDKISSSTAALNDLLHGMLDISKLDASVVENTPRSFNLFNSLDAVYAEFNVRSKEKGIDLVFDIPEDIHIFLDEILFERIVRNLLDNAVKYTNEGSISVIATENTQLKIIELAISDTGIGIPENKLKDVFVEFSQLDNHERDRQKGLGLGLSIVKKLCELVDVEMELNSIVGEGTKVILNLPIGSEVSVDDAISQSSTEDVSSRMVLIIEDDFQILEGMGMMLSNFGFQVSKALDADQAMAIVAAKKPDLIISDYRLPGGADGLELIGAIRSLSVTQTPAILITGDTAPERLRLTKGADVMVLHKPVEMSVLRQSIETILKLS